MKVMKKLNTLRNGILSICILVAPFIRVAAQDEVVEAKEIVKLQYFNRNNSLQYFILESSLKKGRQLEPQAGKVYQLYLDTNDAQHLISKMTTNQSGKAKAVIPVELKSNWNASGSHHFIAVSGDADSKTYEFDYTLAQISIDTLTIDSTRKVTVRVMKQEDGNWVPAPDVEMKIGVARLGGVLTIGDDETYTTDSTGSVQTDFNKINLPGDSRGNLALVAKVEDNDLLGNLFIEKNVPWGTATSTKNDFFDQRSLWSTRSKAPYWLLFMAYSIVIAIWFTIGLLILQIVRIKKLGKG